MQGFFLPSGVYFLSVHYSDFRVQCWPKNTLQVLFNEAKLPIQMDIAQCNKTEKPFSLQDDSKTDKTGMN